MSYQLTTTTAPCFPWKTLALIPFQPSPCPSITTVIFIIFYQVGAGGILHRKIQTFSFSFASEWIMIILSGRQVRCKFRRIISPYISLLMNRDIVRSSDRSGMNQVSYVLMHGHRCRTFRLNSCLSSET